MNTSGTSPMLEQYRRIKRDHQKDVLFFRLGDFYEMFAEDAVEVSALLNLTLTSRNGLPMCGVPYHAARTYIARLLKLGKKIAICEQTSQPGKGNKAKVLDRQVVEIITPGTTVDEDYLDRGSSNYLAGLSAHGDFLSFAYIDLSTGSFYATAFHLSESTERLRQELERLQVREMLIQESLLEGGTAETHWVSAGIARAIADRPGLVLNRWADWLFDLDKARQRLRRQFGVSSLRGFGLEDDSPQQLSAGALLEYLDDTAKSLLPHIRSITLYQDSEFVGIDESSQRNLELVRNLRDGDVHFSLLEVMDETRCSMGKRLLRRRLLHPLRDLGKIQARLDMVETLYRDQENLSVIREMLGKTPDLERLSSRLAMDKAHGKDMLAVKNALISCIALKHLRDAMNIRCEADNCAADGCAAAEGTAPPSDNDQISRLAELKELLERSICDEPSILLTEGNLIRDGYSAELDGLRRLRDSGRQLLEAYLEEEKLKTGIPSLKIRYNRLIGYFFEVTNAHAGKVPEYFIRRQGVAGAERFSTERLAALESDINGASDKIIELERKLFIEIREKAKEQLAELAAQSRRIAETDVAQSLARAASLRAWVRPVVDSSNALEIYEARHPVVEAHLGRGEFIPNDIILGQGSGIGEQGTGNRERADTPFFAMITGPNMAGKSTYLRSAALITLMAQMGSFIPAREGRIGMCDRIYCRVGASDNLARGESTFLVEMNETAYILNTATEKSLVIMDEVGRGTGTNDGLSIAWAVCEELLGQVSCRTFFATHFHELSHLPHPGIANRSMEVLEKDGSIIFLRKLKEGPTAESYGIHVARLAGLPLPVIGRAEQIMERLRERVSINNEQLTSNNAQSQGNRDRGSGIRDWGLGTGEHGTKSSGRRAENREQRAENNVHTDTGEAVQEVALPERVAVVCRELRRVDPDRLTPLEALGLVAQWKRLLEEADTPAPPAKPVSRLRSAEAPDTTPSLFD